MIRVQDARIIGRTRMQAALPISAGHRIATWRRSLADHITRLEALGPSVFRVQLGGAIGDRSTFGSDGDVIAVALADMLNLQPSAYAWTLIAADLSHLASALP